MAHPLTRRACARRAAVCCLAVALGGTPAARADDPDSAPTDAGAIRARPHAVYAELLGKGGPFGVGYDYAFAERFAAGAAASYFWTDGDRVLTLAPYLNWYPGVGTWGAVLVQPGLELVHVAVPSQVVGWSGTSSTGVAAQLSVGYEYRTAVLFRFVVSGFAGRGGLRPWVGLALGGAL